MTAAPPTDATAATAIVLCSKGGKECAKNAQVQIAFPDLQEMQNHMRETIDQGLGDLQSKQGQGGLPAAPPSAKAPPIQSAFVAAAPPPEQNVAAEIKQESQEADQAEQEVASAVHRQVQRRKALPGSGIERPGNGSHRDRRSIEVTATLGAAQERGQSGNEEDLRVPRHEGHVQGR